MTNDQTFTDAEIDYVTRQPLGRLATVGANGIEIRGHAETHTEGGEDMGRRLGAPFTFHPAWIRVVPRRILAWGIDVGSYEMNARDAGAAERARDHTAG